MTVSPLSAADEAFCRIMARRLLDKSGLYGAESTLKTIQRRAARLPTNTTLDLREAHQVRR